MRIILSPAKTMKESHNAELQLTEPVFLSETERLLKELQSKSKDELKTLYHCNDKILEENLSRLQNMSRKETTGQAIFSYDGLVFKNLHPETLGKDEMDYLQAHLRILSAFHGVLKPFDGIHPYRLEMKAKLSVSDHKDLYSYWNSKIHDEVLKEETTIINLASEEYSKCVLDYRKERERIITIHFLEKVNGELVTKGTLAKMLRGKLTRYLAIRQAETPEEIKNFQELGYQYWANLSDEENYVFVKE